MNCLSDLFTIQAMDYINNLLAVWGLISIIICVIGFFNNTFEESSHIIIKDNPSEEDINKLTYYTEYNQEAPEEDRTLLMSVSQSAKNIRIYNFNIDKGKWNRASSLICKNLSPNQGIIFNINRPEGLPMYKIKWSIDYGATSEYIFSYNGFSGVHSKEYCTYYYSGYSKIRKILNIK
ncbi:hypothetical protein [Anaerotignum propionicum]|uniref:Uncharacterized protein n=1 Tax=Anaerotignum propionicum DSM 1682 TaxID=991789 RepID=A0A0X8VB03_ANAPI|nr:hypothetical protein [Anaerotignum propionicum]AMJ39779.1 hypothetical protein CPRO_01550 [Anaerotignum propionicum DSM 1682]SHE28688.1 hypothetical protein SAMN02745151_00199 [[Clostridium] propionicum DSM 1682] [Anaerotignum propionicum DSM 1682]